jgi:hypothetical protein
METEIKTVFVSSSARASGSGNAYTVYLQTPVKDIYKAELLYASVPNSLYNLTNGTDVIEINGNTFSIPVGFYDVTGLARELTNALVPLSNVSVTYLSNEGKYVLWNPSGSFTVSILSQELRTLLGFTGSSYTSQVPPSASPPGVIPLYADNLAYAGTYKNFVKSDTLVNTPITGAILLDIQELRSPVMYTGIDATCYGSGGFNPFAVIPIDVISGNYINFKKGSSFDFDIEYPHPIDRLDRITVRWTDTHGKLLNFNGVDENFFVLRLHTTRKNFLIR